MLLVTHSWGELKTHNPLGDFFLKSWTTQLTATCLSNTMLNSLFFSFFFLILAPFPLAYFPGLLLTCHSLVIHCRFPWLGFFLLLTSFKGAWWQGGGGVWVDRETSMLLDLAHPTSRSQQFFSACPLTHQLHLCLTWCVTFSWKFQQRATCLWQMNCKYASCQMSSFLKHLQNCFWHSSISKTG